eukprot:5998117-Ditylum_brightwellii.AAC.1
MGDITETVFTANKGIWQVETLKAQIDKAMQHATEILDKYGPQFPEEETILFSAFLKPRVLNTYSVPALYTKTLASNVEINESNGKYDKPPKAWERGSPKKLANKAQ